MRSWFAANRLPIALSLVALVVYGLIAGDRLRRRSPDSHFAAQADAWLHGKLEITDWPAGADDPARVEEVELDDGTTVRGRRLQTRKTFRMAGGAEIPIERVQQTVRTISYNSFPPFPSVLLLPQVLLHGAVANDVALTAILSALIPFAFIRLLRRLRAAGLHDRGPVDETWLTVLLSFGTVLFFASVQGRVWFTAHVVGVLLAIAYVHATVEARHPVLAGLFLGLAFATRTPMLFMAPLFLFEAWRVDRKGFVARVARFAGPVALIGGLLAWFNWARFGELTEFGHSYLAVRQQAQMERYGLFDLHYLGRNLAVALTLLPELSSKAPFISISGHGLALWFTTPALLLVLWPKLRGRWHIPLLVTLACVAGPGLLYQNSGWLQFGYRFSLDYVVLLVVLLALSGRPFRRGTQALIVFGVLVNLFGAITFNRVDRIYRSDAATYDCVVPH